MKRAKFLFNIPDVKLYPVHPSLLYSTRLGPQSNQELLMDNTKGMLKMKAG